MGLNINGARFLLAEKRRGLAFGSLLTLGRQEVYMSGRDYSHILGEVGSTRTIDTYGDDFFLGLGAESLDVMDASDYEGAKVIHDLNQPIANDLHASFDTVIDGGTLEHVFHFPNSIKSCMELVKPGGHLILMTPWHNYAGHGFYQFSPELFYNILSPENGFTVERMLIVSDGHWYSVKNPTELKSRIEISSADSIDLYISAKRTRVTEIFTKWPQQSDYSAAWTQGSYGSTLPSSMEKFKEKLITKLSFIGDLQSIWRRHKSHRRLTPSNNPGMMQICKSDQIPT